MCGWLSLLAFCLPLAVVDPTFFDDLLKADRDRHARNASTMEKFLEMQYVGSKEFRDATAGRIILEAGSGRTRAETNNPAQTSAQNQG